MAFNEQCKFTSALLTLNAMELKDAINNLGLGSSTDEDMNRIIDLIREDIGAFSKHPDYSGIPVQWRPSSFAIISGVFDESNGLVNSTMKLVRYKARDYYRSRLDEIYASGAADPHLPENRAALREILK